MTLIVSSVLSVIVAVIVAVPLAIIKMLLLHRYAKILGVLIVMAAMMLCLYISLVNAAIMGEDFSNNWAFGYMNSWLID